MIKVLNVTKKDLIECINKTFEPLSDYETIAVITEMVDFDSDEKSQSIVFSKNLDTTSI